MAQTTAIISSTSSRLTGDTESTAPDAAGLDIIKILFSLFFLEKKKPHNVQCHSLQQLPFGLGQSCSISMFPYRFNINYSVCLLINTNININYFKEGLSISILYQLLKKLPYQFQYQYILSISPYDIVKITNFLSISHCYQYQC